jgi:hypothetical protein
VRRVAGLLVLATGAAATAQAEPPRHSELDRDGPWLTLDPVLTSQLEGLGAAEHTERVERPLGPHATLVLETSQWENDDKEMRAGIDLPGRGWRAAVRLAYDLGPVTLGASAAFAQIDNQLGHASHIDLGVSLFRTLRLSRWMTAWISLGLGHRRWLERGAIGTPDATEWMLTVGTTFR